MISNEGMDNNVKIVKSLEESGLLIKVLAKQSNTNQKYKGVNLLACY